MSIYFFILQNFSKNNVSLYISKKLLKMKLFPLGYVSLILFKSVSPYKDAAIEAAEGDGFVITRFAHIL